MGPLIGCSICWPGQRGMLTVFETISAGTWSTGSSHQGSKRCLVGETGDLTKGTATVGVQRQYTGTAGRIENAQVAVYLTLVRGRGHTFIDRALYLPRYWTDDTERRHQAGVPEQVEVRFSSPAPHPDQGRQLTYRCPLDLTRGHSWPQTCPRPEVDRLVSR
jgi:hypothetical protein